MKRELPRMTGGRVLMFAKLLFIIAVMSATICALLVIRQNRIDTFHEISSLHQKLMGHERALWEMRIAITERSRPSQIRIAMNALKTEWIPIQTDAGESETGLSQNDSTDSFHSVHLIHPLDTSPEKENEI